MDHAVSRHAIAFALSLGVAAAAAAAPRDKVVYEPPYHDPVITEMEDANEAEADAAGAATDAILAAEKARKEQLEEEAPKLRFDLSAVVKPAGPDAFSPKLWHFPPQAQYLTGTCWSFSTTSFLESEIKRTSDQEIKLSEIWFAYWEYVAKARGWVASRGQTVFAEGSQGAAVFRVMREHGVVPLAAYPGVLAADGRHDHAELVEELHSLLEWCRDTGFWDEEAIVVMVRAILDRTLGPPPTTVAWQGQVLTPEAFMADVTRLDPDAYVDLMSTLSLPFWTRGEYRVPDNWWHGADYLNLPLDDWYAVIGASLDRGYSLVIGGDVSEPGLHGFADVAVVPSFDIPGEYIDQDARELRFDNGATADDHGIHLVGRTRAGGHDWFLIKDSGRSSRWGAYQGYYMYRDDFVKLKMLTLTVHRDAVAELVARVDGAP